MGPSNYIFSVILNAVILFIMFRLLMLFSMWKLFYKAGRPGWFVLIPFLRKFIWLKIIGKPTGYLLPLLFSPLLLMFIAFAICQCDTPIMQCLPAPILISFLFFSGVLTSTIHSVSLLCTPHDYLIWIVMMILIPNYIYLSHCAAASFGKKWGFSIGLILLPFIFWPLLAFGKSQYIIEK